MLLFFLCFSISFTYAGEISKKPISKKALSKKEMRIQERQIKK